LTDWAAAVRGYVIVKAGTACDHLVALTSRARPPYKPGNLRSVGGSDEAWLFASANSPGVAY
jgi:hypothetical protein